MWEMGISDKAKILRRPGKWDPEHRESDVLTDLE
jgi:hypothetical protein